MLKDTESKNRKVVKNKNGRIMFLLKCAVFESKKSKFVKKQEAKRLLCKLTGIKVPVLNALPMANIF